MNLKRFCAVISLSAVAAGCAAVYRAGETKNALAAKAFGIGAQPCSYDLCDLTLREYVEFAMTNRPEVVSASIAVARERSAMTELEASAPLVSSTPWNAPRVSASVGHSESSVPSSGLRGDTDGSASGSLSLNLLVYDFGRHDARVAAQTENVIAAELGLIEKGYGVFEEVSAAYFALKEKDALLAVAVTNEHEYSVHLRRVEDELAVGEAKALDIVRARLDLAQARERLVAASNDVVAAVSEFRHALGMQSPGGGRAEIFEADPDPLGNLYRGFDATRYDSAGAMDMARTNSPSLAIARSRLRAAGNRVDYALADLMPNVSASVSLNWTDPLWYWQWGCSAVQSVFEGGGKVAAVDSAVLEMENAATAVDEAEQALSLGISLAVTERDDAASARETAAVSLRQARDNLELVSGQYEVGEASRVDCTSAVAAYAAALGGRVSAFYRAQRAEARLFALIGSLPRYREEKTEETR